MGKIRLDSDFLYRGSPLSRHVRASFPVSLAMSSNDQCRGDNSILYFLPYSQHVLQKVLESTAY